MITQSKRLTYMVLSVAFLLLLPLVAMQFTNEVNWTLTDFVAMGALLLSAGLTCEFVMRKTKNLNYQIGIIAAILVAFLLIWAELAVGIFGSPFAGN